MKPNDLIRDGDSVTTMLDIRNEEVKKNLEPILQEFIEEKNTLLQMKKVPKLGYRFMRQIMLQLAKVPPMSTDDFFNLDFEIVNFFYVKFSELIAYYNRYFEIVDNKLIFQRYMGIDTDQYARLENHDDERIRRVMQMVDGDYIGMGWVASESGEANATATAKRLSAAGGAGHSVMSATEQKVFGISGERTQSEWERTLAQHNIQLLTDEKK